MKKVMVLCCMLAGVAFSQAPAMKKFSTMLGGDYVAVTNPVAVMSNHLATAAHFTPAQYVQVTNLVMAVSNLAVQVEVHTNRTDNPHEVTAAQIGALTIESDPLFGFWLGSNTYTKAEEFTGHTNRMDNPHQVTAVQVGALIPANTNGWTVSTHDNLATVASVESLSALVATNIVQMIHDSQSPERYLFTLENGTGTVWEVLGPYTNLQVVLSENFEETSGYTTPAWRINEFPFTETHWSGITSGDWYSIYHVDTGTYWEKTGFPLPQVLLPATLFATGTATVSVASIYYTTNLLFRTANNTDVLALQQAIVDACNTVKASLIPTLNPKTRTLYGDFTTTNTVGFAAFIATNPAAASDYTLVLLDDTATNTASFSYHFTNRLTSATSVAYGRLDLDETTVARSVLSVYNENGVGVASNVFNAGAISSGAIKAWFTNYVTVSDSIVTGGTVRLDITVGGTNVNTSCYIRTGSTGPLTLTVNEQPLSYATVEGVNERFVRNSGGTATNLTVVGGNVVLSNTVNFVGMTLMSGTLNGTNGMRANVAGNPTNYWILFY